MNRRGFLKALGFGVLVPAAVALPKVTIATPKPTPPPTPKPTPTLGHSLEPTALTMHLYTGNIWPNSGTTLRELRLIKSGRFGYKPQRLMMSRAEFGKFEPNTFTFKMANAHPINIYGYALVDDKERPMFFQRFPYAPFRISLTGYSIQIGFRVDIDDARVGGAVMSDSAVRYALGGWFGGRA